MLENTFEERIALSQKIRSKHKWFYIFTGMMVIFIIGVWLGSKLFTIQSGYWVNLFTEGLGVFVSVVMFGLTNKWISDRNLHRSLVTQMRSTNNSIALNAVNELIARNWTDLNNEILVFANLQGADLSEFNLQGCDLSASNLRHTILTGADLRGAYLLHADLTDAILRLDKRQWTITEVKMALMMWNDTELIEHLARYGDTIEGYLSRLNEIENSVVQMDAKTILPDGNRYREGVNLAYYTDKDFPGGKFKPDSGLKNYRLALHNFLYSPVQDEYE